MHDKRKKQKGESYAKYILSYQNIDGKYSNKTWIHPEGLKTSEYSSILLPAQNSPKDV